MEHILMNTGGTIFVSSRSYDMAVSNSLYKLQMMTTANNLFRCFVEWDSLKIKQRKLCRIAMETSKEQWTGCSIIQMMIQGSRSYQLLIPQVGDMNLGYNILQINFLCQWPLCRIRARWICQSHREKHQQWTLCLPCEKGMCLSV